MVYSLSVCFLKFAPIGNFLGTKYYAFIMSSRSYVDSSSQLHLANWSSVCICVFQFNTPLNNFINDLKSICSISTAIQSCGSSLWSPTKTLNFIKTSFIIGIYWLFNKLIEYSQNFQFSYKSLCSIIKWSRNICFGITNNIYYKSRGDWLYNENVLIKNII